MRCVSSGKPTGLQLRQGETPAPWTPASLPRPDLPAPCSGAAAARWAPAARLLLPSVRAPWLAGPAVEAGADPHGLRAAARTGAGAPEPAEPAAASDPGLEGEFTPDFQLRARCAGAPGLVLAQVSFSELDCPVGPALL